ncbi:MAG: hypothetical protein AAFY41_15030, partial [Bacteroidota bacterium]
LNVTVESGSAAVGQEICLDITGSNFNGILGFQFGIDYDPAVSRHISCPTAAEPDSTVTFKGP